MTNKHSTPTEYRQELKHKILETASQQFRMHGIKAVKMDDIASILSVSKRTVYEIYDNKEQLLMETVKQDHNRFDTAMREYVEGGERNVIDILLQFYRLQMRRLSSVSPYYFDELHRYPEILAWLEQKHLERDKNCQKFFKQGIGEGYFRPDADYELVPKVCNGAMAYIMENQLYRQYDLKEFFRNVIMLFIRGLCTLKGITELDKQLADSHS